MKGRNIPDYLFMQYSLKIRSLNWYNLYWKSDKRTSRICDIVQQMIIMTPNANKAIDDVYYNLSSAGVYAGPRKIYDILKQNHENAPSRYKIRQWFQSEDDYTLLKPVRRKGVDMTRAEIGLKIDILKMKRIAFVVSWYYKTFTPTTILVTIFHICTSDDVTIVNEKSIVLWNIWNLTRNVYLMSISETRMYMQ